MPFPSRRSDDADVIRQRLRLLLDERGRSGGWVPEDPADEVAPEPLTEPAAADAPEGIGRHRAPGRETRWDPGRPGARALWLVGLLAAALLAGWTWLDRPTVEPVDDAPTVRDASASPTVGEAAGTSATVVVSVVGQVAAPGLVTLPSGSRVADAVAAAGGLLPGADPASVNLAALVADGEQLAVGLPGRPDPGTAAPTDQGNGLVDLNTAGVAELDALPGIGPVLAQRIVEHRDREGPFRSVDELDGVPGIGPAIAAELAELVTV